MGQVVLLKPPLTEANSPERAVFLLACPICRQDYETGTSGPLVVQYHGVRTVVGVCPSCYKSPPQDYQKVLLEALDTYEWSNPAEVTAGASPTL